MYGSYSTPFGPNFALALQLLDNRAVYFDIFAALAPIALPRARSQAVFIHGRMETSLIHLQTLLASHIAGSLERQAESGVQIECFRPSRTVPPSALSSIEQLFELAHPGLHGALEALLFAGYVVQNRGRLRRQFRVRVAILVDDRLATFAINGSRSPIFVPKREARRIIIRQM